MLDIRFLFAFVGAASESGRGRTAVHADKVYSTVTDFARFLGLSISQPLSEAI